jgi:hypothetical protein
MSDPRVRRRVHFACMIVIALLYLVSVPWYRDAEAPLRLWLGLPDWVAVALLCYVGVAMANALAWIVSDVSDGADDADDADDPDRAQDPRAPR